MRADERGASPVGLVTGANRSIGFEVCLVNAACLGLVDTSSEPVAAGVVWARALPDDGPTGGFFRDSKPLSW